MSRHPAVLLLPGLFLVAALAGCGGIGGSGLAPDGPDTCVRVHDGGCLEPERFNEAADAAAEKSREHPGFQSQWGLTHINADEAYGNLSVLMGPDVEPGAGVTIGVLDTGVDLEHPSIAGNGNRKVTEVFTPGAVDETLAEEGLLSHGTAVASVAAGARTDADGAHHGVAWGADLAVFALPLGSGDGVYRPVPVEALATVDAQEAARYGQIFSWRDGGRKVDILNLSLGYPGLMDRYSEEDLREYAPNYIATLAQADAEEKVILVWAAGNSHGDQCDPSVVESCPRGALNAVSASLTAGLPARIEELRGHSIAVVALNPADGRITSFSNRCGIAADFCIAAPGEQVRSAYFGNVAPSFASRDYVNLRGTSFAAPVVSGGLALMKQLFRDQLSNTDLVARLFETADRSGFYADPAIYGQGSMDLGAATSPVGVLEVPVGASVGADGFRLLSTSMTPGTAFGDSLRRSLASREVMALDRLGAPFWYRLGRFTGAAGGPSVTARLRGFLAPDRGRGQASAGMTEDVLSLHAAILDATAEVRGSHMSLAQGAVTATLSGQGGLSAAAFTTKGVRGRTPAVGATLGWRRPGSPLGLRAGWIGERETLLGSVGEGAFGTLAGDTSFVGVDVHTDQGGWGRGGPPGGGGGDPAPRGGRGTRGG
ncbi:MAG: S8 family serine peptidase [Deltaproteobacteria bacterium]|nr:S8 family serine peptidase [Deltaproteobacteria bacterium]